MFTMNCWKQAYVFQSLHYMSEWQTGLHTVGVMPQHPFELPEGLCEVFQLVMEVNVLLYQGVDRVLQLKVLTFQHKQSQWDQEKRGPESSHAAHTEAPSHLHWHTALSASVHLIWRVLRMWDVLSADGGRCVTVWSLIPKPWMESSQRASLKSIKWFHISGYKEQKACSFQFHLI